MEVKFDTVRIGKIGKGLVEILIEQNTASLKENIKRLLKESGFENESNKISIVLVIQTKGMKIEIAEQYTNNEFVKNFLISNFQNSIYKGRYSMIDKNTMNQVHPYRLK